MRTIAEVKTGLDGRVTEWRCDLLAMEPARRAVLRYVVEAERAVGASGLVLAAGTITIAHYWIDRPFNVYHWLEGGSTVAFYANVAEPLEISFERVAYRDLALDVLIRPSGSLEVLDEEELPADLAPRDRKTIAQAMELLVTNTRALVAEVESESRRYVPRPQKLK